ncbi:CPBP family glutamic-type intramembrane protease [Sphingomonas sp. NIBR02145]|uniref:CPBP family glutamic-type intramembrane protease n=1 Tax=Sphingomonas sp. NIBR02145 TaxID=3014784 RepID=UPI0022B4C41F|nr:CPBP family glutamic-type intramembrane protease [Sphingomonas sp. NIBR02145]WHU01513.1 CPBP family glutamic-type intramembrane protease [Sphingomonas sp. NIBR02145]
MIRAGRRLHAALVTWPDARGWRAVGRELLWGLPLIALLAFATGLAHFDPMPFGLPWLGVFFTLMLVPALGEELVFRGLIVPPPDRPFPLWQAALAVGMFVLWHPLQALTFGPPWSAIFLDSRFLMIVAVLGALLARLYRATGSIWPCVCTHWLIVAGWKLLFAGPIG